MTSIKKLFDYMCTPDFSAAFQRVIENERQDEIEFRLALVNDFNAKLDSEGRHPDSSMLTKQERFVSLLMATDEVHSMAAEYAAYVGKPLPPPPPSLTLDNI